MDKVSVVVAPRERHSSIIATLGELRSTVDRSVRVIVVEGGAPRRVQRALRKLQHDWDFTWIHESTPLVPNRARNIGASLTDAEFVAFLDNDMVLEPGWLEALVTNAEINGADVVAPVICIGPPRKSTIHHAGGILNLQEKDGRSVLTESHRLMDCELAALSDESAPLENEVAEFHCLLVRRSFLNEVGPLDERLITREQMDFALRCLQADGKVTFEKSSVVTYLARKRFRREDLAYHLFRWSDNLAVGSMDTFESSWKTTLERDRIRFGWIQAHRRQAIESAYFPSLEILPPRIKSWFVGRIDNRFQKKIASASLQCEIPKVPTLSAEVLVRRAISRRGLTTNQSKSSAHPPSA